MHGGGQSVNSTMERIAKKDQLSDQDDDYESVVNHHPKTTKVVSLPDEFHPFFGQTGNLLFAKCLAPTDREIRRMLLALRRRLSWSRGFAAVVIGVSESCVEKWEKGRRKPRGASRKLIWLLHSQFARKDGKIKNAWDMATWGQIPCRNAFALAIEIGATQFVTEQDFLAMAQAYNPPAAKTHS